MTSLGDLRQLPVEVAREQLRAVSADGSIYCRPEADGSFRLTWRLLPEALLVAQNETPPLQIRGRGFA